MSHLKKIFKLITNIFIGLLLVLLLLVIYGKLVSTFGKNVYPNYFGYTFFEVASGSMEPALHVDDIIIVNIGQDEIVKDDIIAYQGDKDVITHRVLFIDGDTLTVKGDANNTIDKPIKREQIIGKVVKVYPKLGVWKKVLTDPKILIAIFVTLILFDFALSYNSNDKKDTEIKEKKKLKGILKSKEKVKKTLKEEATIKKIEIPHEEETKKEEIKEDNDNEKLLELTRKINIDEINKLLEGTSLKLNENEVANIKKEAEKVNKESNEPQLSEKEKEAIDYTIRLDLSEIQKKINEKLK